MNQLHSFADKAFVTALAHTVFDPERSKVGREGTYIIRRCATDGTALAIGSYRTQFCPHCSPDVRALYCSACDNPAYVTGLGHPFCLTCNRLLLRPADTYFRGERSAA